jgi:hypothetical protein
MTSPCPKHAAQFWRGGRGPSFGSPLPEIAPHCSLCALDAAWERLLEAVKYTQFAGCTCGMCEAVAEVERCKRECGTLEPAS